jgi:hypothetical protein
VNGAPTPKNFALGAALSDSFERGQVALPRFFLPSRFERLVNPVPVVPVMVSGDCGCGDEEQVEEELV